MLNLVFGRHFGFAKCLGLGGVKGGEEEAGKRKKKRLPARPVISGNTLLKFM